MQQHRTKQQYVDRVTEVQAVLQAEGRPALSASLAEKHSRGAVTALNLAFDLTPRAFITGIVTEFGLIPPTSVPVILREKQDDDAAMSRV